MSDLQRFLAWSALIAALVVALIFGSFAISDNYNSCVAHNGQHYSTQQNQNGSPVVEPAIDHPTLVRLTIYCGGIYANDNGSGITAFATILLFVVTGLLGLIAYRQYVTSRAQLRAYVWVKGVGLGQFQIGSFPVVALEVRNAGQTPAYNFRIAACVVVRPYPLTPQTAVPKTADMTNRGGTVHPGMEPPYNVPAPMRDALDVFVANALVNDLGYRLVVFSTIKYDDAFGDPHETHFCASIKPLDPRSGGDIVVSSEDLFSYAD